MPPVFQSLGELGAYLAARPAQSMWVVDPGIPLYDATSLVSGIWSSQPSVRKVVDFIASNIASIPLHVYDRVSDTDRQRVTDHPLARTMAQPSPLVPGEPAAVTAYRFWHTLIVDWLLWDRWAAAKIKIGGEIKLQRIPPRRFRLPIDGLDRVTAVRVWGDNGQSRDRDPREFVWDAGYTDMNNQSPYADLGGAGTSPMATIAHLLAEAAEAVAYRRSVWKSGARIPAVIERDKAWSSDTARDRFEASWRAFTQGGGREGGTPILEDGMKLAETNAFKPQETEDLEGRRLSDQEVASFYHIAPELVGSREGTYSNIDAFHQMLYQDSLGPYIFQLVQTVNLHLTPDLAGTRPLYVEANLEAKLAGSFITQAEVLQKATGAPYMTRSEARARLNLPQIADADQLVVPLNVLVGGQASPQDSGSQNRNLSRKVGRKARPPETYIAKGQQVLSAFFRRQGQAVRSRLGAKAAEGWWDKERWDAELAGVLYPLGTMIATRAAQDTYDALALDPDEYDEDRTLAYLTTISVSNAKNINATTRSQIEDALLEDDPLDAVGHVFDIAESSRAEMAAAAIGTFYAAWGTLEAGRQAGGGKAMKTWITGANPRPEHAAMDGETVPVHEPFSNGCMWPGDAQDPDGYGCNCDLAISVP